MFSIFNKKKNSNDLLNVLEHSPKPSSAINTESIIADKNYEENDLNDVPIDDELDLGNLSSGPRQPILKVSRLLITTSILYINIINMIFKIV